MHRVEQIAKRRVCLNERALDDRQAGIVDVAAQPVVDFLKQRVDDSCSLGQSVTELIRLGARCTAAKSLGKGTGNKLNTATA